MKEFTIELDDTICAWLEHISSVTDEPIEKLIANGIYNQIAMVEEGIVKGFTFNE